MTGSITSKLLRYQLSNVVRSKWLLGYTAFHFLVADALLRFGGEPTAALLSLINVVLLVLPLVTVVFGTMYLYDAREFTELLLAQPLTRRQLFGALYLGLSLPLAAGFAAGVGAPFLLHAGGHAGTWTALPTLIGVGVALTFIFTALAFLLATRSEDRVRGLGMAIGIWLLFAVVYDGAVLILASIFADYPLERALLGAMIANPVDMGRVVLLLRFDVAALMGYTGAVFKHFFGSAAGALGAASALLLWAAVPTWLALRAFKRKSF